MGRAVRQICTKHPILQVFTHYSFLRNDSHAHDVLTTFMIKHGFQVDRHYLLETAWRATFTHGEGGRTIGVNSEMDGLPIPKGQVTHACGHNLIAIAGVAVALGVKKALEVHDIAGTVVLLGTPGQ